MSVPTLETGYSSATTGRGDHEVHKGHVVALGKKKVQWANTGRFDTRVCTYIHVLDTRNEIDVQGLECERLDFTEVAQYISH
jgi:hypothetical protein